MAHSGRRRFLSALAAVAGLAMSSTLMVVAPAQPAAATVPGRPGEPQPGTPIFTEDFSNESAADAPIRIGSYTGSPGSVYVPGPGGSGADGETYTADPAWSPGAGQCNGWIMRETSPLPPNGGNPPVTANDQCARNGAWDRLREMTRDMGLFQGQSAEQAATNQALTEYTNSPTGRQPAGYQLETDNNSIPAVGGHFYAVSAIFAERNCTVAPAQRARERFELLLNGVPTVLAENLSPCTDPGAVIVDATWIAKLESSALQLAVADTPTLGMRLYDATASGVGNDVAFDLPQIVDVTPQLDKAFSPATIAQGQTSTLTLTITNTDDLQAKNGMSFTDDLPAGVTATGVNSTTCADATVTAAAGATSVVFAGDIGLGVASCTISVQVTSEVPGSYVNTGCAAPDGSSVPGCTSDFPSIIGINPPGSATLRVLPAVDLAVTKSASPSPYVPGESLTWTVTVTNNGPSDAVTATVTDPLPLPGFTWTCTATTDSTCTTSGSGDINDTVTIRTGGTLTYTITGTVPADTTGDLTNTTTVTPPPGVSDPGCTPTCTATTVTPAQPTTDLAVTKAATPNPYVPGETLTWTVTVTNNGPSDAVTATVTDPLPLPGFTWTCTATTDSTCTTSGSGDINDTVTIRTGGTLTYTITGTVPADTTGDLTNTTTVTPPPGVSDPGCTPECAVTLVVPAQVPPTPVPPTPVPPTPVPPTPVPPKPVPHLPVTGSGLVTIASVGAATLAVGVLLAAGPVLARRSRRRS